LSHAAPRAFGENSREIHLNPRYSAAFTLRHYLAGHRRQPLKGPNFKGETVNSLATPYTFYTFLPSEIVQTLRSMCFWLCAVGGAYVSHGSWTAQKLRAGWDASSVP
jgi:hypothetical protein